MDRWISVAILGIVVAAVAITTGPGPASAESRLERCLARAERALGHGIDASAYDIVLGTDGKDFFEMTDGPDLRCGFRGRDRVGRPWELREGDIFIGGPGGDKVNRMTGGVFIGGAGIDVVNLERDGLFRGGRDWDVVDAMRGGRFKGGASNDFVVRLWGGVFLGGPGNDRASLEGGTFRGQRGRDYVGSMEAGTFYGGAGGDVVRGDALFGGTFFGGPGNDRVSGMSSHPTFDGGDGVDTVLRYGSGTLVSVEVCTPAHAGVECP